MRKRITWDFLSVELTRKCQLKCKHCFRGKAQNLTLSKDTIDKFLSQTEIIGYLHFTGGEPTLALDEMSYFLDCLYKYRIPLFHLQVITNGYEKSEEFVKIIKDYSNMIRLCYLDAEVDMKYYVTIGVSTDRYHVGYDPKETVEYYKEQLKGYAKVIPMTDGNTPVKKGYGVSLPEAFEEIDKQTLDTRVEILSKDLKPMCPQFKTYNLLHDEQIYVVCEMSLSAKGNVTLYRVCSNNDYRFEDLPNQNICNVNETDSIYDEIIKYNKGKKSCLERIREQKIRDKKRNEDPAYLMKMLMNGVRKMMVLGEDTVKDDLITFMADKKIYDPVEDADKLVDGKYIRIDDIEPEQVENIMKQAEEFDYSEEV